MAEASPPSRPEQDAETAAYQHWREESKRAEREFRLGTRKPRAALSAALEEADRRHKERFANARRSVTVAHQAHRRDVELARIEYRKAIDLVEANLKETMAKARAPVHEAEASLKSASEQSRRTLEAEIAQARDVYGKATDSAYADRRKIKAEAWAAYLRAHEAAQATQRAL